MSRWVHCFYYLNDNLKMDWYPRHYEINRACLASFSYIVLTEETYSTLSVCKVGFYSFLPALLNKPLSLFFLSCKKIMDNFNSALYIVALCIALPTVAFILKSRRPRMGIYVRPGCPGS